MEWRKKKARSVCRPTAEWLRVFRSNPGFVISWTSEACGVFRVLFPTTIGQDMFMDSEYPVAGFDIQTLMTRRGIAEGMWVGRAVLYLVGSLVIGINSCACRQLGSTE